VSRFTTPRGDWQVRAPVAVRFEGVDAGSPLARQLGQMLRPQIDRFYRKAAAAHAAGVTEWSHLAQRTPDMAIRYHNNYGQEIVHVTPAPGVVEEARKRVPRPPWEWLLIEFVATAPVDYALIYTRAEVTAPRTTKFQTIRAGTPDGYALAPANGQPSVTLAAEQTLLSAWLVHVGEAPDVSAWTARCDAISNVSWTPGAAPMFHANNGTLDHDTVQAQAIANALAIPAGGVWTPTSGWAHPGSVGFYPDGSLVPAPSVSYDSATGKFSITGGSGGTTLSRLSWYLVVDGYVSPQPVLHPEWTWFGFSVGLQNDGMNTNGPPPDMGGTDEVVIRVSAYPFGTRWETQTYSTAKGPVQGYVHRETHEAPKPWGSRATRATRATFPGDPPWSDSTKLGDAHLTQPTALPPPAVTPAVTFKPA